MTTEVIEGNVETAVDNVTPEPAAPVLETAQEQPDPDLAEAERLLEAEAARPQERSFADLSDEDLLADPRVNGIVQRQRMSAAQQAEEKLRRQAGNDETVRQYVTRLRETTDDPAEFERAATEAIRLNREYQQEQVMEYFSNGLKTMYQVPPEHHEKAVTALAAGDREGYIRSLVDGVVEARLAPMRAEIEAAAKERAARIIAAEIRAARVEAAPKIESPPRAPTGAGGVPMSIADIEAMPTNEWLALPTEQRRQMLASARTARR